MKLNVNRLLIPGKAKDRLREKLAKNARKVCLLGVGVLSKNQ
jgi:hypothetical protein